MTLRETFKNILEDNIEDYSKQEAEYYIDNDAIPDAGSVSGLIFYSETEPIAKEFHDEINELIKDAYGENACHTLNDMTWIAWSIILPGLKDEVLNEIPTLIKVPPIMFECLSHQTEGIEMDIEDYVLSVNKTQIELYTTAVKPTDASFAYEIKAYALYNDYNKDSFEDIDYACNEIYEADDDTVLLEQI